MRFVFFAEEEKNFVFVSAQKIFSTLGALLSFFSVNLSFNAMRHHLGVQFINDLTIMEYIYHFPLLVYFFYSHFNLDTFSRLISLKFPRWLKKLWMFHRSYKQIFPEFRPFSLARENLVRGKWKFVSFSMKIGKAACFLLAPLKINVDFIFRHLFIHSWFFCVLGFL